MTEAPSLQDLEQYLATLAGVPIYRVPLVNAEGKVVGNNGDALIHLGAWKNHEDLPHPIG